MEYLILALWLACGSISFDVVYGIIQKKYGKISENDLFIPYAVFMAFGLVSYTVALFYWSFEYKLKTKEA